MRALLSILLVLAFGCELVVDFDRSRIVDGGPDTGTDVGTDADDDDAGVDAGTDANDAGMDAGDAGMDAGDADMDAGDAGMDVGMDAGDTGMCTLPSECDDTVACTDDTCTSMSCVFTANDARCADDGNPCTSNTCDPVLDCQLADACSIGSGASITLADLTTVVVVPDVETGSDPLFLVIFDDASGAPDMVLGSTLVPAGSSGDVSVDLVRPAVDGETLYASLYEDVGVVGTFEPAVDTLAMDTAGDLESSFMAIVPAGTPDAEVTVSGDSADYTFSAPRPSTLAIPTGADPAWALIRGYRYRVVNMTPVAHPFEFVTGTTVQLSQDVAGPLEGNATIDWDESDTNDVLFTVSAAFEVIDAYRCSIHTAAMRGTVSYVDP